jgi:hypothetical protein
MTQEKLQKGRRRELKLLLRAMRKPGKALAHGSQTLKMYGIIFAGNSDGHCCSIDQLETGQDLEWPGMMIHGPCQAEQTPESAERRGLR